MTCRPRRGERGLSGRARGLGACLVSEQSTVGTGKKVRDPKEKDRDGVSG